MNDESKDCNDFSYKTYFIQTISIISVMILLACMTMCGYKALNGDVDSIPVQNDYSTYGLDLDKVNKYPDNS